MGIAHETFELRRARSDDFGFAWSLYRDLMKPLTIELLGRWNEEEQKRVVELALAQKEASIIIVGGLDAGWFQVSELADSIYLGQLYVVPGLQDRGIGTALVSGLKNKARQAGKTLTLDVTKNNRARALYERLGFQVLGESEHKLKMRWQEKASGCESK